jgi:hypothetical protein
MKGKYGCLHSKTHQPLAEGNIKHEHGKATGESYNTEVRYIEKDDQMTRSSLMNPHPFRKRKRRSAYFL